MNVTGEMFANQGKDNTLKSLCTAEAVADRFKVNSWPSEDGLFAEYSTTISCVPPTHLYFGSQNVT